MSVFITQKEALKEEFEGRTNYWMCRPEIAAARDIQICRAVLPPGTGHDFHFHPELEEALYVVKGEMEQWVERERRILKEGELAHIPRGVVHASFNTSRSDVIFLAVLSPALSIGPVAVDVYESEPWRSIRSRDSDGSASEKI